MAGEISSRSRKEREYDVSCLRMASNEQSWIGDTVHDFIHSSIWLSPIQTFIDNHCASFDIDDETPSSSNGEEEEIYAKYRTLVRSLIEGLGEDLKLDQRALKEFCERPNSLATDESYEQLFSANDFDQFKELMRRKNLILQLQAMVHLQLECGVLKPTETEDDRILQLLVAATKPMKSTTKIESVPEEILREKLQQLTVNEDDASPNVSSRREFLKQQRDLIIEKQRDERVRDLEKEEKKSARPQSAVKIAKKAMLTADDVQKKLRREVLDKH